MSTARLVPETWGLEGDDARETLRHVGARTLMADSFVRLRVADGFSHARSLALMTCLVLLQGLIGLAGIASTFGGRGVGRVVVRVIESAVPGQAGAVLAEAVRQGESAGANNSVAVVIGFAGALLSATTAFGQLERGLNRLYGVEADRPTIVKYLRALLLAASSGLLMLVAFVTLTFGETIGDSLHNRWLDRSWSVLRWPAGLALVVAALAVLFHHCPRRHQPPWAWLAFAAGVSVTLWAAATIGFSLFLRLSPSFGETYGPLAGIVALLLWAMLSSAAVLYGAAVAAQLEAVRAARADPQDPRKVAMGEPLAHRG